MNELPAKHITVASTAASSSLAIVQDKRPTHRSGGCIGILFHLFDWNRRLAKKKLFPKKFLPPVRPTKKDLKKFGGDEKKPMAKVLLIADENRGGFPNSKKRHGIVTRASGNAGSDKQMCHPGLVARLMGLESMPSVRQGEPRKAVDSAGGRDDSKIPGPSRHDWDLDLGMGGEGKHEPTPQKLCKTDFFERRRSVSTCVVSESLPFSKSMLLQTRKQRHKLMSPVKSPRFLCRKNSRLMEAAAKILEPSQRNRTKTLTYLDGIEHLPSSMISHGQELACLGPCQCCGNLENAADSKSTTEKYSLVDHECSSSDGASMSSSNEMLNTNKPRVHAYSNDERAQSLASKAKANVQNRARENLERKTLPRRKNGQTRPKEDSGLRSARRQNDLKLNQMSLPTERFASRPNSYCELWNRRNLNATSNVSNDFISVNRNLSNYSRATPVASTTILMEVDGDMLNKKAKSQTRKTNINFQIDEMKNNKPHLSKKRRTIDKIPARGTGLHNSSARRRNGPTCSTSRNDPKSNLGKQAENSLATTCKNSAVASLTFNAPSRHQCSSVSSVEELEGLTCQESSLHGSATQAGNSSIVSRTDNTSSQRGGTFTSDELSALLEQKIKELNSLGSRNSELLGKSTASILKELIAALTKGSPINGEAGEGCKSRANQIEDEFYNSPNGSAAVNNQWGKHMNMQEEAKRGDAAALCTESDCDQHSPLSILEVSFSTDSDLTECLTGNTGSKNFNEAGESLDSSQSWDPATDFSDSAFLHGIKALESISIMYNNHPHETGPVEGQPCFVRDVISNIDLLFGSLFSCHSEQKVGSSIFSLLLDALGILLDKTWKNTSYNLIFPDKLRFRQFLLDYVVEYLDKRYGYLYKSGYQSSEKSPTFPDSNELSREVYADFCKCGDLGGKILDGVIEKEMCLPRGKWMDSDIEEFEIGISIEHDILQALVGEILTELIRFGI